MKRLPAPLVALGLLAIPAFAADPDPHAEWWPGLTLRVFDIGRTFDRLWPLGPDQTPNLHVVVPDANLKGPFENASYKERYQRHFVADLEGELKIEGDGTKRFRLFSDDGAIVELDGKEWINNDGLRDGKTAAETTTAASPGWHKFHARWFQNGNDSLFRLEEQIDGQWKAVPGTRLRTGNHTLVASPGRKRLNDPMARLKPGFGLPLESAHPDWKVVDISPDDFTPRVGGLALIDDGDLLVASFNPNQNDANIREYDPKSVIYRLHGAFGDPASITRKAVAGYGVVGGAKFSEILGLAVVDNTPVVSCRDNLYRLYDDDQDGIYEKKEPVLRTGWSFDNFHQFPFGIAVKKEAGATWLYGAISVAIYKGGMSAPNRNDVNGCAYRVKLPARGQLVEADYFCGGFRTPNGISVGPEGSIVVADNQGGWNPANSLVLVEKGGFYGHLNPTNHDETLGYTGVPNRFDNDHPQRKTVYLPQNEISNSPTQGVMFEQGPFKGQMLLGELTNGGLRRVFFEKVGGEYQGGVVHHSQGFEGGINRMIAGPGGSLVVGCMGAPGNWSWRGKLGGLERLDPNPGGKLAFEIHSVSALPGKRLRVTFTGKTAENLKPADFVLRQWDYKPSASYGGPKVDDEPLTVSTVERSGDGRSVVLTLPALKPERVVYLLTEIQSADSRPLWAGECWYTANTLP